MKSITRIETIGDTTYCAYCGKALHTNNYSIYPEVTIGCDCELATQEMDLFKQMQSLYARPLADSLVELKVEAYRSRLRGEPSPVYSHLDGLQRVVPASCSLSELSNVSVCVGSDAVNYIGEEK